MTIKYKGSNKKQEPGAFYNQMIDHYFGCKVVSPSSEIGLEIECEGTNLPNLDSHWVVHAENSLKSYKGCPPKEYVLNEPIPHKKVPQVLHYLADHFKKYQVELNQSNRTSVHVHLNCQKMTIKQVYTLACLYYIFEETLVNWCGPTRVGNLFALRVCDAETVITTLADCAASDNYVELSSDNLRYASLNVAALAKYGSLEFRALRGSAPFSDIQLWVDTIIKLRDMSLKFSNPQQIAETFSEIGAAKFYNKILGPGLGSVFKCEVSSLHRGMRAMQEIAFANDWDQKEVPGGKVKTKKSYLKSTIDSMSNVNWEPSPLSQIEPFYVGDYDHGDNE